MKEKRLFPFRACLVLMALTVAGSALANNNGHDSGHGAPAVPQATPAAVAPSAHAPAAPPPPAGPICNGFGPQTPRDIRNIAGRNMVHWRPAPPADEMNLCNIHTHTSAEHAGPGFSIRVGDGEHGGYACNDSMHLSPAQMKPLENPRFAGVKPGDTIEVHWVFTTCDVNPGPTLGACLSERCSNPELRVEAQVFLLVNDPHALNFNDYVNPKNRRHPRALPTGSGQPVEFLGSTTGPKYSESVCSPMQVTWSVRPQCAQLDINSLDEWGAKNIFEETHSHGVRQLVTSPELLAPIE